MGNTQQRCLEGETAILNRKFPLTFRTVSTEMKSKKIGTSQYWLVPDYRYTTSIAYHHHYKGGRTTNASRDYRGQIDYFAVYSPYVEKVYLIPVDHVGVTNVGSG